MMGDGKLFDTGAPVVTEEELDIPDPPKPEIPDPTRPLPFTPLTGATFSPDGVFRYDLWRRYKEEGPICLMLGLNPSKANAVDNDKTITREENFARSWGYALLVKCNLFAYVATDPKEMKSVAKFSDVVGDENDATIMKWARQADRIICAWGNGGSFQQRDRAVLKLLQGFELYALRITKKGQPQHPLYLPSKTIPFVWSREEELAV